MRLPPILLSLLALAACENDPSDVAAMFPDERPDAEIITDFETIYSDSAQIKVRVTGPRLVRSRQGAEYVQEFPEGVFVEFFDDAGGVSATLAARWGIRYEGQEFITVRDSVVWEAVGGDRLDTDELIYDAADDRIYSDRYVRLRQGDKVITGVGFESNPEFTRSRVRAVRGVVTVPRT